MVDAVMSSLAGPSAKLSIHPDFNPNKYKAFLIPSTENTIVWGRAGASPFEEVYSVAFEVEEQREIQRTFDVVRVKDPDNEDNHVDVEVMTQWVSRSSINGQRVTLNLARQPSAANIEVMQRGQTRTASE